MKKYNWEVTSIWIWADVQKTGTVELVNDVSLDYDGRLPFRHGNQRTLDYSQNPKEAFSKAVERIQAQITWAEKRIFEQNLLLEKLQKQIEQNLFVEYPKPIEKPTTWTCRCCETEYQDDFRCISTKNVCMNCCACAFGMSKPDLKNKACTPIQLKDIGTFKNDNDNLPF